ncbi:MAG: penicillin-binding protein 2 [Acidimicrobiia bacterium]|nr:penicillin-binding protein 2 [Acidimicrobiia bacterium]
MAVVVVSLFAVLFGRLWYLQVMASPEYAKKAEQNIVRFVQLTPPRGRILDRNGVELAGNTPVMVVTIDRSKIKRQSVREDLFRRLAKPIGPLDTTPAALSKRYTDPQYQQLADLPLAEGVDEDVATFLMERRDDYPGIDVATQARRTYPYGPLAAHVLGYVGRISDDRASEIAKADPPYQPSDIVGVNGVEKIYESQLRGVPGLVRVEVNARGVVISRTVERDPVPGNDVKLTIDAKVQNLTEQLLYSSLQKRRALVPAPPKTADPSYNPNEHFPAPAGSALIEDAQSGDILAMASYPTFDPREMSAGISTARSTQLFQDKSLHAPLLNRATQGEYAPGSTFKLVTSASILSFGIATSDYSMDDVGTFTIPGKCDPAVNGRCVWSNAGKEAHGRIDLVQALTVSSDVYFYQWGWAIEQLLKGKPQQQAIQREADYFGFGKPTAVQLPFEASGYVPSLENNIQRSQDNPKLFPKSTAVYSPGANINLAVGQGDLLATPLQLVNAYASFANGGNVMAPNVVDRIVGPKGTPDAGKLILDIQPRQLEKLSLPAPVRDPILRGLSGVVDPNGNGTAKDVFVGFPLNQFPIAGKTGTAQTGAGKSVDDTSLFVGFQTSAPILQPQYVIDAVLEKSGFGAQAAAPLVRSLFDSLLTEACKPVPLVVLPPFPFAPNPAPPPPTCSLRDGTAQD